MRFILLLNMGTFAMTTRLKAPIFRIERPSTPDRCAENSDLSCNPGDEYLSDCESVPFAPETGACDPANGCQSARIRVPESLYHSVFK